MLSTLDRHSTYKYLVLNTERTSVDVFLKWLTCAMILIVGYTSFIGILIRIVSRPPLLLANYQRRQCLREHHIKKQENNKNAYLIT